MLDFGERGVSGLHSTGKTHGANSAMEKTRAHSPGIAPCLELSVMAGLRAAGFGEKFVNREIRRENKYDAIIMDPPSYGRGASRRSMAI